MEPFAPDVIATLALTSGVGVAMIWLGTRMHMLERRRTPRRCPSCGRLLARGASCGCC